MLNLSFIFKAYIFLQIFYLSFVPQENLSLYKEIPDDFTKSSRTLLISIKHNIFDSFWCYLDLIYVHIKGS